jgi:hypothetical protein
MSVFSVAIKNKRYKNSNNLSQLSCRDFGKIVKTKETTLFKEESLKFQNLFNRIIIIFCVYDWFNGAVENS